MSRFRDGYHPENLRDLRKALLVRDLREIGIEGAPFQVLAGRSPFEVLRGSSHGTGGKGCGNLQITAFEEGKEPLRMFFLIVGRVGEKPCDLLIPFFLCLGAEIGVPVPRLRLSRKCLQ